MVAMAPRFGESELGLDRRREKENWVGDGMFPD
jgi:hypothetical protein